MTLFGIALILVGAVVLYAMRRSLWPLRDRPHDDSPPDERHWEEETDPEYDDRPIYVPPERGTVYVSDTRDETP